jgi:CHAT domain-containing protein
VDDKATYLLMVRFAQEWFPTMDREAPAVALARAQRWLRRATNRELRQWEAERTPPASAAPAERAEAGELIAVRGRGNRFGVGEAAERITAVAELALADARPYRDPIYWSAFQIAGW